MTFNIFRYRHMSSLSGDSIFVIAPGSPLNARDLAILALASIRRDTEQFADQTGSPVRSQYAKPGAPRSLTPDAILVAPATYNAINKWAQGGPGGFQAHPPRTGGSLIESYPWHLGIDQAERAPDSAARNP